MRCLLCGNGLIIKKQLFGNDTVHVWSNCSVCKAKRYLPKTQENLKIANGWIRPEEDIEKKKDWDELLGLIRREENFICGNCKDSCYSISCSCPCHWP